MHELSLAYSLVEMAVRAARENNITKVDAVHLRLGQLSGVAKEALLFGYEIAAENTPLSGSRLEIEELPVIVLCPQCRREHTLPGTQNLDCPVCHAPTSQIVQGKEIEMVSLSYHDEAAPA